MEPNELYTCVKCRNLIQTSSKILHDQYCNVTYPKLDEILNNKNDLFKFCQVCGIYLSPAEFDAHFSTHARNNNGENRIMNTNMNSTAIISQNGTEVIPSYSSYDGDDSEEENGFMKDSEFVDLESVQKEMNEDEIYQKKFESKKMEKKKERSLLKDSVAYLFDTKYRRVPPIVRLIGSIFDRRQLMHYAADEIGSRIITSIEDRYSHKQSDDDDISIIIDLLPENEIQDPNSVADDKKDCLICMDIFVKKSLITTLPCTHLYHSKCIKEWLKVNNSCPVCKFRITKESIIKSY